MSTLFQQVAEPLSDDSIVFIYGLVDPKTGYIRYVGKAADVPARYKAHFSKVELSANTKKVNWIKSLLAQQLKPTIAILERVPEEDWKEAECRWIEFFRSQAEYPELTNGTSGGDGIDKGTKFSEETRRKMSQSGRGRKHTPESLTKMSASQKARVFTQEHRDNMSAAQKIFWKNCTEEEQRARVERMRLSTEQTIEKRKLLSQVHSGTKRLDSTSKYMGVQKIDHYWRAWIYIAGKNEYLGRFSDEIAAARCRDCASIRLYGGKAKTNFPISVYSQEEIAQGPPKNGKRINNTSGYKGVYWHKGSEKWIGAARLNGKQVNLGRMFPNTEAVKIEGARTYDRWVIEHLGPTAYTNFPRSDYQ